MKTNKVKPAIVIILLVLTLIGIGLKTRADYVKGTLPIILSETQYMSVDNICNRLKRSLDKTMPGHYNFIVDKDALTITIDQWTDGLYAPPTEQVRKNRQLLEHWNSNAAAIADTCKTIKYQMSQHGHPEYTVICRLLNCDDLSQTLIVAEDGIIVYDILNTG